MTCPVPETVQGQVGQGFEQPCLVKDVPARGRGVGARWSLKVPSNPNHSVILWSKLWTSQTGSYPQR